jgi:1-deoxy-D-xylulose-5-phosphate reductoisomerase
VKQISLLGSTGSIGRSTLDVVRANPGLYDVCALAAGTNTTLLFDQIDEFKPEYVSVATEAARKELRDLVPSSVEIGVGVEGAINAATYSGVTQVVSAIAGAAGLLPTMAAIRAGKDIALANKETLVMAGHLFMEAVEEAGVTLMPVDSEHSAVFQSIKGHRVSDIERVILTASGGPFLNTPKEEFAEITPESALKHPKWKMGSKISIDSATLVNKGLEVIEARWLFDLHPDKISVLVHPQSIVHSMVEYVDGSIISQLSEPDMKGPIAYALGYPGRVNSGVKRLDLTLEPLTFFAPDTERFPCLSLAFESLTTGGVAPAVLNGADEVAVEAFLNGRLSFTDIYSVLDTVLQAHAPSVPESIEEVVEADGWARRAATEAVLGLRR